VQWRCTFNSLLLVWLTDCCRCNFGWIWPKINSSCYHCWQFQRCSSFGDHWQVANYCCLSTAGGRLINHHFTTRCCSCASADCSTSYGRCLSVRHKPVLYWNGWMELVFSMGASSHLSYAVWWRNSGIFRNKGTSLWNFCPKLYLENFAMASGSYCKPNWSTVKLADTPLTRRGRTQFIARWSDVMLNYIILICCTTCSYSSAAVGKNLTDSASHVPSTVAELLVCFLCKLSYVQPQTSNLAQHVPFDSVFSYKPPTTQN